MWKRVEAFVSLCLLAFSLLTINFSRVEAQDVETERETRTPAAIAPVWKRAPVGPTEAPRSEATQQIHAYFAALQAGDAQALVRMLDDPLRSELRELLEENPAYPDFLRRYFRGARMEITKAEHSNPRYSTISARIFWSGDPHPLDLQLVLRGNTDGSWRIVREIRSKRD